MRTGLTAAWTGMVVARETIDQRETGVSSAWVKEQRVQVENDQVSQYQANVMITFVLEDGEAPA